MKRALMLVAIAALAFVSSAAAQNGPLLGTWKLNLEKSKYSPGPAPKSMTRTIVADGNGVKYSFEGVGGDGKPVAWGFSTQLDGKDSPITGTSPNGTDAVASTRTDANHYVAQQKKAGKVIGTAKVTVSKDGKTATVDVTGTTATGAKEHDVQVWDKQ